MAVFNEKDIKKHTGAVIYERGEKLYLYGMVKDFKLESEAASSIKEIKAVVTEGFDSALRFDVDILLNYKREIIEEFNCSCDDFKTNRKKKACKHVVAAFLRYLKGGSKENIDLQRVEKPNAIENNESKNSYKSEVNDSKLNDSKLNAKHRKEIEEEKNKTLLRMDYKLYFYIEDEKSFSIEINIGENDTFLITDIIDFLNAYKHKNYAVGCGGGFVFLPQKHYFNKRDTEILNFLSSISPIAKGRSANDHSLLNLDKKSISTLFQLIKEKSFAIKLEKNVYYNVRILNEDMPLLFNIIKKEETKWILNQIDELPVDLTGEEKYFFYKGNVYVPSFHQVEIYKPIYYKLSRENMSSTTLVKSDNIMKNEFIPSLKEISAQVNIIDRSVPDEKLESLSKCSNFKTYIYIDKKLTGLSLNIKFSYNGIDIDIFSDEKYKIAALIKNRDIQSERMIINQIKNMGFEMTRKYFIMTDEDEIIGFMTEGIRELSRFAEITYSETAKNLRLYSTSEYKVSVGLRENGLLEFSFDIEGVSRQEVRKIFDAISEKLKYYKLTNGRYINLRDRNLKNIKNLIDYLDTERSFERDKFLTASRYNALYVDQYLRESELFYIEKNSRYREITERINNAADIDFTLPKGLDKVLRSYQKIGFKWLKTLASYGFGGVLADEMGLGKTLQAIAFIASEKEISKENKKPVLVVTPTSLVYNWEAEVKKFTPDLKTLVVYGIKRDRIDMIKEIEDYDLIITSYAVLRNDIEEFKNIEFSYCFIDEAQQIKNSYSQNSRAVKLVKASSYFALTGTPMENSLLELWSVFDFIMPGYLLSKPRFIKKYEEPILYGRSSEALEALKKHTRPFILRRLKKEVLMELPDKIEQRLVIEMNDEQKAAYMAYALNSRRSFGMDMENAFRDKRLHVLSALTSLRQLCCDPSIVIPEYEGESAKMEALKDLLVESISDGHRMLIFSQFVTVLHKIAVLLKTLDIEYMYLDGSTKSEDRFRMMNEFNMGKGSVFLLSLKAGGFGLNLTGADIVVHFDPWWNPAVEEQATDRAHRIGQNKTVEVIKLIAKGTIEEKIFNIQERKKKLINDVITKNNADELILSSLTNEEIEELFTFE